MKPSRYLAFLGPIFCSLSSYAVAANQTWDDASTDNTWSTSGTATNWDAGTSWTDNNTARFTAGTGEAVNVNAVSVDGIDFTGSGYLLSGGTINLNAPVTTISGTPQNVANRIDSNIVGSGGLFVNNFNNSSTVFSTSKLTLGGTNTFEGPLTIQGNINTAYGSPTLELAAGSSLTTSTINIGNGTNGGTNLTNRSDNQMTNATLNFASTFNASFSLWNTGGTNQSVQGIASTGVQQGSTLFARAGIENTTASSTSTVTLTGSGDYRYTGFIRDNIPTTARLNVLKSGSGTQTFAGQGLYLGTTTVSGGTLALENGLAIHNAGAVIMVNNAGAKLQLITSETIGSISGGGTTGGSVDLQNQRLTVGDATSTTYSGAISGIGGGLTKQGSGTLTLGGSNSYDGTTLVTAGTLLVNGALGDTAVTVSGSSTIGGTGSIGGTVSVGGTGKLSAGASSVESLRTGDLSMTSGTTFDYGVSDNGSTGADVVAVDGTLSLAGVTLSLDSATLAALESGSFENGGKITLISYEFNGSELTSGFTNYEDDTTYVFGSNEWIFNYNDLSAGDNFSFDATSGGQNRFITMTAVPEPSAALLGGLGVLALLRRRRN